MPYANPEDQIAYSARRYVANREAWLQKNVKHRADNPKMHAFLGQRHTSKQRGVEFKLTFEEWVAWWGDDFEHRGRRHYQLQMCRYGDEGAYELGNIYKASQSENKDRPRYKADEEGGVTDW